MAGVSIRKSIRWLPNTASEPTSTIVLSSAERRFVDIRILKPANGESEDAIDWAIAGTSSSVSAPEKGKDVKLSTFHHWIDSRTVDVEAATDAGYMYPMPSDGEDEIVLEKGTMVNPETGLQTEYEEVWIEEEVDLVPGNEDSQVVVLDFDQGVERRGRVVRIGKLCQGLLRVEDGVVAERWEWDEKGGWARSKLVGREGALPCEKLLTLPEFPAIQHEGNTWTVVERSWR